MISFRQTVVFRGGPHNGRVATILFSGFRVGMVLNVDGAAYRVKDGAMAQTIAKTQAEMKYGAVVMESTQ